MDPWHQDARNAPDRLGKKAGHTRQQILDVARAELTKRGFAATTIEHIAAAATVSRATFYTYFREKRDVLAALSDEAEHAGKAVAARLSQLGPAATRADLAQWVSDYLGFLDRHGAFVMSWYEASRDDEVLRGAGRQALLQGAAEVGRGLALLHGDSPDDTPADDPAATGFVVLATLERVWQHTQHSGIEFERAALARVIARQISPGLP